MADLPTWSNMSIRDRSVVVMAFRLSVKVLSDLGLFGLKVGPAVAWNEQMSKVARNSAEFKLQWSYISSKVSVPSPAIGPSCQ